MNKIKGKWVRRILLGLAYVLVLVILLAGISRILAYMNQGADRGSLLFVPLDDNRTMPVITLKEDGNEGEVPLTVTMDQLKKDYIDALDALADARATNDITYLEDHFTDELINSWEHHFFENRSKAITEKGVSLSHHIDVQFHSLDQSVIAFTDTVQNYHQLFKENVLIDRFNESKRYDIICVLEDGRWRISAYKSLTNETSEDSVVNQRELDISNWKGVNYYPASSPWNLLDEELEDELYTHDMNLIKEINGNVIRIFLQYDDFGGADIDSAKLNRLKHFLSLANESEIKVILTFFDFYGDYSIDDWRATDKHLRTLITELRKHPAILAYDLKNEPDLDFDNRGQLLVSDWLEHKIELIRSIDTEHPITIGWSNAGIANLLSNQVDFVSFHFYGSVDQFSIQFQALDESVDRPIVMTEFGMSSYKGFWNPIQFSKTKQAKYYAELLEVITKHNLGYISWTLHDFQTVPTNVVGRRPWRKAYQRHYGLVDANGVAKPAFKVFVEAYHTAKQEKN